jgi:NAD(P)-dependent dehydrogenase (short-subunit alcohol dehydrogenase family)
MNLEGKSVLVTGSTDGVGRFVARRLADRGARVLIHGRDRVRGAQLVDDIRAAGFGSATFLPADFSSLAGVRSLAGVVFQNCECLDILINNAGIGSGGATGRRQTSQDGHELRFAVNYLAGFLLTRMLLPLLMLSKPARTNRTCGFPASGSPTGFTVRHTARGAKVGVRGATPRRERLFARAAPD